MRMIEGIRHHHTILRSSIVGGAGIAIGLVGLTVPSCSSSPASHTSGPSSQDGSVTTPDAMGGGQGPDAPVTTNEGSAPPPGDAGAPGVDAGCVGTLPPTSLAVSFANMVLTMWPDPRSLSGTTPAFEYNAGIVLHGIQEVYLRTGDPKYLAYIKQYVDDFVNDAGTVNIPATHSFDNIQPAILLPFLWQETGLSKYQLAAQNIRNRFDTIPRNADQGFWHKQTYPNQMWLDGIYMGEPFLSRYSVVFSCGDFCPSTVVQQTTLLAAHVQDDAGLLYHAWDDTKIAAWANPTTGVSPVVWGRADGWFAMSLVDTLGDLPADYAGRTTMLSVLQALAAGLEASQDKTTGLWDEVLDEGSRSDDWNETSCSGMFVYALKTAVDRGYVDSSYTAVVNQGWQGLKTQVSGSTTSPIINNAVPGLGVQSTYAAYVAPTPASNTSHGLCAILLAASVMESTCP
jgi:unsaturated rhamnogalacturonyl hydrolase